MTTYTSPTIPTSRRSFDTLAVVSLLVAAALIHGPVFGGHAGYVAALGGLVVGLLVAALTAALRVRAIGSTLALAAAHLVRIACGVGGGEPNLRQQIRDALLCISHVRCTQAADRLADHRTDRAARIE